MKALLLLLAVGASCALKSYEGYRTYRVVPSNADQLASLASLSKGSAYDFWSLPRSIGQDVDVLVSPARQPQFEATLQQHHINYNVLISNYQDIINRENEEAMLRSVPADFKISFDQYYRYDDIVAYIEQLQQKYPDLVTVSTIGTTYEGRDIKGVTVSSGGNGKRNAIYLEGGIHAREWVAPATNLYLLNQLVEHYDDNKALLDNLDWLIVPVTNPDGYEYTHTNDRMWRKNRNKVNALCKGTDSNRNFGFKWGGEGASSNPCDETYRGASAFSEKESQAIRDFGATNKGRVKVYIALHSYGPYLLYPWGYQWDLPDDWQQLDNLANAAAAAIRAVRGTRYEVGSSTQLLYAAAGGSDDYMKGSQDVAYAYTMELVGGGSQGFNPPPSAIQTIVKETFEGLKVMAEKAATL